MLKLLHNESLDGDKPITLEEFKLFLRLTHNAEDALLESCMQTATELFEIETGLYIYGKRKVVWLEEHAYQVILPDLHPISIAVMLSTGQMLADYKVQSANVVVLPYLVSHLTITYEVLPDRLLSAHLNLLLQVAAELYHHRGKEVSHKLFSRFKKVRL